MPPTTPSIDQLKRAIQIAEEIDRLETELGGLLGRQQQQPASAAPASSSSSSSPSKGGKKKGRGKMSAEGRERIAAAQRARWAKQKDQNSGSNSSPTQAAKSAGRSAGNKSGGKRTVSPEARAKMAEAARKRWAKAKK